MSVSQLKGTILGLHLAALVFGFQASAYAGNFGMDGRDGRKGQDGRNGTDGRDVVLKATSQPVRLDLSGQNGEDSTWDGEDGHDATGCMSYPREPEYNLLGADGGHGGSGGDGGSGGRGGDVTVLYTDKSHLKNITVVSMGGRGGQGAKPGKGGWGCSCFHRSWTIRRCHRRPDNTEFCEYRTYTCQDGYNGIRGSKGIPGFTGDLGRLTLIKGNTLPPAEFMHVEASLPELNNKSLLFEENIWEFKEGAISLLGAGTVLNNRYNEFIRHDVYPTILEWAAKRGLQEFVDVAAKLELKESAVQLTLPDNIWATVEDIRENKNTKFKITEIVKLAEVRDVAFELSGSGADAILTIKNGAKYSDVLRSKLHLRIWFEKTLGDKEVFNAEIAADQLKLSGDDIVVNVGTIQMKEKNVFKVKRKLKWQAILTRTMGGDQETGDPETGNPEKRNHETKIDTYVRRHVVSRK